MKMPRDNFLYHIGRGNITLQIPEMDIYGGLANAKSIVDDTAPDSVDYPDEWFEFLYRRQYDNCLRLATKRTRRSRFLHLSRIGYEANKEKLKKAYEDYAKTTEGVVFSWRDVELKIEEHFSNIKR